MLFPLVDEELLWFPEEETEVGIRHKRTAISSLQNNRKAKQAYTCSFPVLSQTVNKDFPTWLCPNIAYLLQFWGPDFITCCLAQCTGSVYCSLQNPVQIETCGGFDEKCDPSLADIYINTLADCTLYSTLSVNELNYLYNKYCVTTTTTTTTTTTPSIFQVIQQAAPAVVAAVGAVAAVVQLAQPPSGSSSVNPSPGSPGGGAPPVANSAQAAAALSLAPLGTVPVAVFPPYATPRTLPSISVIFAENPTVVISAAKRSELSKKVLHFASLTGNILNYFSKLVITFLSAFIGYHFCKLQLKQVYLLFWV